EAELLASGAQAREAADQELVRDYAIAAVPAAAPRVDRAGRPPVVTGEASGRALTRGPCVALLPEPGRTATFTLEVPPGGLGYRTAPENTVETKLGRFAEQPVVELPPVAGSAEVAIPGDRSQAAWDAELTSAGRVLACAR